MHPTISHPINVNNTENNISAIFIIRPNNGAPTKNSNMIRIIVPIVDKILVTFNI